MIIFIPPPACEFEQHHSLMTQTGNPDACKGKQDINNYLAGEACALRMSRKWPILPYLPLYTLQNKSHARLPADMHQLQLIRTIHIAPMLSQCTVKMKQIQVQTARKSAGSIHAPLGALRRDCAAAEEQVAACPWCCSSLSCAGPRGTREHELACVPQSAAAPAASQSSCPHLQEIVPAQHQPFRRAQT